MQRKLAVLLNFTANSYHWGCFGTSMEIYETLIERGYYVELFGVEETHALGPTAVTLEDFDDPKFFQKMMKQNPRHYRLLSLADVVVVNGEGTLHRDGKGAVNLLYLAHAARQYLNRRVHLINCSFFPSGTAAENETMDKLYGRVARKLDRVVPREALSQSVMHRLNVPAPLGFDCLPRFIDRLGAIGTARDGKGILLSGGARFNEKTCQSMIDILRTFSALPVRYVIGARGPVAIEDQKIFDRIRRDVPDIMLINTRSMTEWLDTIGSTACLISGRFHHTIAAASLGTPFVSLASNTPKVGAMLAMLGRSVHDLKKEQDLVAARDYVAAAIRGEAQIVHPDRIAEVIVLSEENFIDL